MLRAGRRTEGRFLRLADLALAPDPRAHQGPALAVAAPAERADARVTRRVVGLVSAVEVALRSHVAAVRTGQRHHLAGVRREELDRLVGLALAEEAKRDAGRGVTELESGRDEGVGVAFDVAEHALALLVGEAHPPGDRGCLRARLRGRRLDPGNFELPCRAPGHAALTAGLAGTTR